MKLHVLVRSLLVIQTRVLEHDAEALAGFFLVHQWIEAIQQDIVPRSDATESSAF